MTAPSSQLAVDRPISFVLHDKPARAKPVAVDLAIPPEDLTRSDASRLNIQQTLSQNAWADNFGPGLSTITIAGHTGWRPGTNSDKDGIARFIELRDQVFNNWHTRRDAAVQSGINPDGVELIFSDALDRFSVVVAPQTFVLRRSKSRPLLCQYQIVMTVLSDVIDTQNRAPIIDKSTTESFGLDSLSASIDTLTAKINSVKDYIDATLVAPVKAFLQQTVKLFNAVKNAVRAIDGVFASVISVAQLAAQAGANLFHALATVASIPSLVKSRLMQTASAYTNIFCVLKNAINPTNTYQDYSGLLGSSNCSSTAGGAPLSAFANQNAFFSVFPTAAPPVASLTNAGRSGLNVLARSDAVLAPLSPAALSSAVTAAGSGLVVA